MGGMSRDGVLWDGDDDGGEDEDGAGEEDAGGWDF